MRLAWFRPATHVSDLLDDTAALVRALSEHDITVIDQARAHEFTRLDAQAPFDLCVFELADTDQHGFVWPYVLDRPGLLHLRSYTLYESRARMLWNEQRAADIAAEVAFDNFELTGAPIRASRLTVVSSPHVANRLNREYPGARVKYAPLGTAQQPGASHAQPSDTEQRVVVVGSLVKDRSGTFSRAVTRARDAGASFELMTDASPERVLRDADAIIALEWPPVDEPTPAIAGLSAARPVMVCDTEYTAGWPTLDPQTWQPRGWTRERPIAVSIDPRDEEHSLFLALRRLASDPSLRRTLGTAAFDWWRTHATAERAAHAWRALLAEAASA